MAYVIGKFMPICLSVHTQGVRCPVSQLCLISVNFISGQLPLGWQGSPRPASWLNLEQWAAWKDDLSSFPRGPLLKQRAVVSQAQGLILVTLGWKSKEQVHVQLGW